MNQTHSSHKLKQGFSLIELLVVMAIIATLMGLVIGVSGAITRKTAVARARAELADLMNELEIYKSDEGSYPADWAEFGSWYTDDKYAGTAYTITDGEANDPVDPWGTDYSYTFDPTVSEFIYLIGSYGPDGTNNNGDGDDITNRNGSL
jgi:general secretion pathway protein G